jgi:hypothetical protein
MSHLSSERLAALADDPPSPSELAHLTGCVACSAERHAFERLLTISRSEQARIGVPLSRWESIALAFRPQDEADYDVERTPERAPRLLQGRTWLRAAAAVLLVAGGMAAGRFSAGASALPHLRRDRPIADRPVVQDSMQSAFATVDEAREARARYEMLYQNAAAYLAAHDSSSYSPDSPAAMRTRLAALDRVGETMRAAMHQAPYDPVINGYYLTTMGQREATIRQLNTSLPAGIRINSF